MRFFFPKLNVFGAHGRVASAAEGVPLIGSFNGVQ